MIISKFPSLELGLQYEIAELLKSVETKGANEKNIMRVQMELQGAKEKNIMLVPMEFQKNITTNYYLKLLSRPTQR